MDFEHPEAHPIGHHYQENYSAHNPVPTVQNYQNHTKDLPPIVKDNEGSLRSSSDKTPQADGTDAQSSLPRQRPQITADANELENGTKEEIMERMGRKKKNPAHEIKLRGQRIVEDPVTKSDVIISDAQLDINQDKNYSLIPPRIADDVKPELHVSPSPVTPGNICLQPFPPPVSSEALKDINVATQNIFYLFLVLSLMIWWTTAFGAGFWSFLWRSSLFGIFGIISFSQTGLLSRKIEKEIDRVRFEMHRQRGVQHSPPTPESTEWLNAFISTLMGLLNPDMFLPLADTIEDVMQASLPTFIDAVKISDMGLGDNPFRIISMRALPDQPGDPEYPRDNWITGSYQSQDDKAKKLKEEQSGDYVNYEVAFAYQARPGQTDKLRSHNIHLLVEFFLGLFDWTHIPIPIWIQIEGITGTIRLRLQMIPEMPYIRNLTFTMMGVPKISVSAKPMMQSIPNVLDLPVISGFVQSSIAAACAEYVAPKFMTMNIQEMLSGPGIQTKTRSLGAIMVTIHHATGLSSQDASGYSDPYIVLAYAKFGKPIYSTRIIEKELNPVFEETAFLLLSEDEIQSKEKLSVMLWDSDERSADDLVGRIELSVSELIQHPNQLCRRTDGLRGFQDANEMPGKLTWSVGYFSKVNLVPRPPKAVTEKSPSEAPPVDARRKDGSPGELTMKVSPSREWRSGILSVIIHHINNLERANLKGASGDREGTQGQDTAAPSEQDENLPSGYCEIIVNDQMIYKTRVKQYTTMPFFEAGTEHFIRDWTEAVIRIAVRDSRIREKDPLLGVINIDLEQLFEDSASSQVTRVFSLQEGVGFGRAQISVLFESVELKLPNTLTGWGTATLEITSTIRAELPDELISNIKRKGHKLKVKTIEDTYKLPLAKQENQSAQQPISNSAVWVNESQLPDYDRTLLRVPIYERYKSNVVFQIGAGSKIGTLIQADFNSPKYIAVLWLHTIEDDVEKEIRLPIISGPNLTTLRQNFINDQTNLTHNFEVHGYLIFKARVDPGLDPEHAKYAQSSVAKHTFEAYDNTEGQAEQATRNAHALAHKKTRSGSSDTSASTNSDGHASNLRLTNLVGIKSREEKAIQEAHRKELHSRHRGAMQYGPIRTSIWMKEGIGRRARELKNRITGKFDKEPDVPTEGRS